MAPPRILVREDEQGKRSYLTPAPDFGWQLISILGGTYALLGLLDIALTWYPFAFGNPDWEFGTVASTLDGLPVPTLGVALLLGAAVARGSKRAVRIWSTVLIVMAVTVLAIGVVYLLNVPLAFKTVQEPMIRTGLKKAVSKAVGQMLLYPVAFGIMAVMGLKHSRVTR